MIRLGKKYCSFLQVQYSFCDRRGSHLLKLIVAHIGQATEGHKTIPWQHLQLFVTYNFICQREMVYSNTHEWSIQIHKAQKTIRLVHHTTKVDFCNNALSIMMECIRYLVGNYKPKRSLTIFTITQFVHILNHWNESKEVHNMPCVCVSAFILG